MLDSGPPKRELRNIAMVSFSIVTFAVDELKHSALSPSPTCCPLPDMLFPGRKHIKLKGLALDHKVTGERFHSHVMVVGQRLSQKHRELDHSTERLQGASGPGESIKTRDASRDTKGREAF